MTYCEFCDLTTEDKKYLLYENEYWSIFLADKQDYIGRCIVVLRSHKGSLSELNEQEWLSLKNITNSAELLLKNELNATMFNWSCLMNDAYKNNQPQPHIHFHVRPRYAAPVCFNGQVFCDEAFAHHYDNHKENQMNCETRNLLFSFLKEKVPAYFFIYQI